MGSSPGKPKHMDPTATLKATSIFLASSHNEEGIRHAKLAKKESSLTIRSRPSVGDNRRLQSVPELELSLIESTNVDSVGVQQILHGNPNFGYEAKPKIVRIFTSSTFTDTFYERNRLMEEVYPQLKEYCQKYGYEFQVVDMRWGVREESQNDHMAVELCMRELEACQRLSTGPNFVSFLSHKYGYRPFPRIIPADEFDLLTDEVTEEEEKLIEDWFLLDENTVPPVYTLQPISTHFPNFLADDEDARKIAKNAWWDVFCKLQNTLVRGAKENLADSKKIHKYMMSVTERELEAGILNAKDPEKHCVWFKRQFVDIEKLHGNQQLSRYTEIDAGDALSLDEVKSCFLDLRDRLMPAKMPAHRVLKYPIHWDKETGVNPDVPEHRDYLSLLCQDFPKVLKEMIQTGIDQAQKEDTMDTMVTEILEHSAFRHQLCRLFSGRLGVLQVIEQYVCGESRQPLIVVGSSGSGKTALLAVAVTQCWKWLGGSGATVYRFLGSTNLSSSIKPLLKTLNKQLSGIYQVSNMSKKYFKTEEMKILVQGFTRLLKKPSKDKPLVLVLDALDNLGTADGGRQLEWLPRQLPPHVKVILSMRPEEEYGVFPRCKTIFSNESCYCLIPNMTLDEVEDVISTFLSGKSRALTPLQHRALLDGYKLNPSPLYLQLALDESMRWHSYDPREVTCVYRSVAAMINAFFKRLEKQHGQSLISFALAFLTAAQNGLSETEMEDLLSLNDTVLNDVYQYWVPPVRRLPPLLWVRVKTDLEPYLSKRSVCGVQVFVWSFESFVKTCRQRYLANKESSTICHTLLADYYLGIWAENPQPYKDKKTGDIKEALRYVAKQPLQFENNQYNLRKLNQLPHHLISARKLATLKKEVLCNYEFLFAKISAVGISPVLRDFKEAQMAFQTDEDIAIILEALQLSQHAIEKHPRELAGQLIGRLYMNVAANERILIRAKQMISANELEDDSVAMVTTLVEMLEKLVNYQNLKYQSILGLVGEARQSSVPVLLPHTACLVKPGGQLLHNLLGHHETINTVNVTSNGQTLVTGSDDNTIKLWDVASGELLVSCQVNSDVVYVSVLPTKLIASTVVGTVYIIDVAMGTIVMERHNLGGNNHTSLPLTVSQPNKGPAVIIALAEKKVLTLDTKSLTFIGSCDSDFDLENKVALIQGCGSYMVYTTRDSSDICVVDLKDSKHLAVRRVVVFEQLEKVSRHRSMISAICGIPDKKQVIVCSGQTQDIHVVCLNTGKILVKYSGHRKDRIQDIYHSSSEKLVYFTRNDEIGTYCDKTNERLIQFPHPCKVRKVISCGQQYVITLGEDNILRIWDKSMRAFSPDVSEFSGKVTVHSKSSMNTFQSILDTFSDQFDQKLNETKAILTTEDVKNYWTQDLEHTQFLDVVSTRFFQMPNKRYLLVTQDGVDPDVAIRRFTQCVTIWDLEGLQCVRRFFPPWQMFYIQGAIAMEMLLFTDVGKDGSPIYGLNIAGEVWRPEMLYNGPDTIRLNSGLLHVPGGQYAIGESITGSLLVYDLDLGKVAMRLRSKTPVTAGDGLIYSNIQLLSDDTHLLAVHSQRFLCKWSILEGIPQWEIDLHKHTVGLQNSLDTPIISLHCTHDEQYLLVTVDLPKADGHGKVAKSTAVIEVKSGGYKSSLNRLVAKDPPEHKVALLRLGSDRLLQMVALDAQGTAFLLDEVSLGKHPDCHLVNESGTLCVTWCTETQEDRLTYWNLEDTRFRKLGGFTLDEQLSCVYLSSDGLVVSTATGLVRLLMSDQNTTTEQPSQLLQVFQQPELDVKMEIETT